MAFHQRFAGLLAVLAALTYVVIAEPCNPLTASCSPISGLLNGKYSIDFTQQADTPADWILADHATVTYGSPNGANFTFGKRKDAPYIWTRFYVLFGRIEVVLKAAPGAGIITGAVMMSDDLDEIDWEWSGNNFAQSVGQVQTNFFGKGIAGTYGRGTAPRVDNPQDQFHTYALDWTPDALTWSIDGKNVRTLNNNRLTSGEWQYPQTPSRLHLGLWCSGDNETNSWGTIGWGGGPTDFTKLPYSAYVKSVTITTPNPCSSWKYPTPFDGLYSSVQCTNQTISLPCTYTVVGGDSSDKISQGLGVNYQSLEAANKGVDLKNIEPGQILSVPGGNCASSSTTASITTSSSSSITSSSSLTTTSSTSASTFSSSLSATTSLSTTPPSSLRPSSLSIVSTSSLTASTQSSSASSSSLSKTTSSSSSPSSTYSATSSPSTTSSSDSRTTTTSSSSSSTSTTTDGAANGTTAGTTTSSAQTATGSQYKVVAKDYGYLIAQKLGCTFDALKGANPGLDWDKLDIGQRLNVPSAPSSPSSGGSSAATRTDDTTSASSSASTTSTTTGPQASTTTSVGGTEGGTQPSSATTSSAASGVSSTSSSNSAHGTSTTSGPQSTTSHANVVQPTVAPNAMTTTLKCSEDNCLRNVLDSRYLVPSSMYAFCTGYMTAKSSPPPIPTYIGGCNNNETRVSSACACLVTNYANASGIVTKTAKSGAESSRKRSILRWERARW